MHIIVDRPTFEAHIHRMVTEGETIPCTMYTGTRVYDAVTGQDAGVEGAIGFHVEHRERHTVYVNDSLRGMRGNVIIDENHPWSNFQRIFDEEEKIAAEDGRALRWVIGGAPYDPISLARRVDDVI